MIQVGVHEAKTYFSRLLARVISGEEVIIARSGHPVARLLPIQNPASPRVPGMDKGKGFVAKDFDAPLPKSLLKTFEQ